MGPRPCVCLVRCLLCYRLLDCCEDNNGEVENKAKYEARSELKDVRRNQARVEGMPISRDAEITPA